MLSQNWCAAGKKKKNVRKSVNSRNFWFRANIHIFTKYVLQSIRWQIWMLSTTVFILHILIILRFSWPLTLCNSVCFVWTFLWPWLCMCPTILPDIMICLPNLLLILIKVIVSQHIDDCRIHSYQTNQRGWLKVSEDIMSIAKNVKRKHWHFHSAEPLADRMMLVTLVVLHACTVWRCCSGYTFTVNDAFSWHWFMGLCTTEQSQYQYIVCFYVPVNFITYLSHLKCQNDLFVK